jgi:hypothetical protein
MHYQTLKDAMKVRIGTERKVLNVLTPLIFTLISHLHQPLEKNSLKISAVGF